jgi:hypothetical protein
MNIKNAPAELQQGLHPYAAFYKNKDIYLRADSSYQAQQKAAAYFRAKKSYDVSVMLCDVIHDAAIL